MKIEKREVRHNKNENLDNYFTMTRASEVKLLHMAERVEHTDNEREKFLKKVMKVRKRYETVNDKF